MKVSELRYKLNGFRPFIVVSGKEIDKEHEKVQEFIELYHQLTGKRVGEGTCKNCILDAYMDLSIKTEKQLKQLAMKSKYKLKEGRVIVFQNTDYTNANMTDEVAMKMIAFSSKHAGNFVNGGELLEAYNGLTDEVEVIEDAPTVLQEVLDEGSVSFEELEDEENELVSLQAARDKYKEAKGKKPHWKWSEEKILAKLNED